MIRLLKKLKGWTNQSINQWLNKFIIRDDIKPAPKMPGMDSNARVPDQVN